jgi:ABC-type transporter Mla subunit MlaD
MPIKSEPPAIRIADASEDGVEKVNQVEAEIRDFVRRDLQTVRRTADATEAVASNINTLVQRVAGTTLREIDVLLRELEGLRDLLQSEGERVQREVAGYAQLSQSAMSSTRIIADSMQTWRKQVDGARAAH